MIFSTDTDSGGLAERPVGQDIAVVIPQILLRVHVFNFGLNYLEKILTFLGIRTSNVLKPPYLHFDPSSATGHGLCQVHLHVLLQTAIALY